MNTYVQLGPHMGSRFQVSPRRRVRRERPPVVALGVITLVLVSGLWFGSQVAPPEGASAGFDPVQYVGR